MGACVDPNVLDALAELAREARDDGLLPRIIDRFAAEAPARLDRIQVAAQRSDAQTVAREAHGLAGSAGVVGAIALMERVRRLEQEATDGILAAVGARLAVIEVELRRTIEELVAFRRAVS